MKFPFKAFRFGRLIFTTMVQAANAPLIDFCWTYDREGNRYSGICIRIQPWKREFGQSAPQTAFVVGWSKSAIREAA